MTYETRGHGTNTRHICNILPENSDADNLLVVEVITPNGNWSSYPPHKHDTDNFPEESFLEETYYHRLNPSQVFSFQSVYTDDGTIDETMTIKDHDVVMVPRKKNISGFFVRFFIPSYCFRNNCIRCRKRCIISAISEIKKSKIISAIIIKVG